MFPAGSFPGNDSSQVLQTNLVTVLPEAHRVAPAVLICLCSAAVPLELHGALQWWPHVADVETCRTVL